jgi:hypothetical protein
MTTTFDAAGGLAVGLLSKVMLMLLMLLLMTPMIMMHILVMVLTAAAAIVVAKWRWHVEDDCRMTLFCLFIATPIDQQQQQQLLQQHCRWHSHMRRPAILWLCSGHRR